MANTIVPQQPHIWEQGEDLVVEIIYKEGVGDDQQGVPLSPDTHAVRMDIAPSTGPQATTPVFSFNSDDFIGTLDTPGDTDNEITFPDTPGLIRIKVPRALTLPGGPIGTMLETVKAYKYDLFIRNKANDTQRKLLQGTITVNPSVTHWE